MKEYGLKWIWKQTRGTRVYLLLLSLAGIAMGVVNMGMTTVLMNLVNIAAGNICMAQSRDDEKMTQCAKMANIWEYIKVLDQGFETWIGDGEQAMSSGQMQRIAIARALYQGKKVMLFDEPTANLDEESIQIFIRTLQNIAKEHICIVATHDKRVQQICQTIYEVRNGEAGRIGS